VYQIPGPAGTLLRATHRQVPPYSVVVSGSLPGKPLPDGSPGPNLYCAVIVKRVDEKTRSKTSINELLRD
jgi:2,3,4,5-tetrahydropyridine-2,6-dicarboxylate N-succinyltransferase